MQQLGNREVRAQFIAVLFRPVHALNVVSHEPIVVWCHVCLFWRDPIPSHTAGTPTTARCGRQAEESGYVAGLGYCEQLAVLEW